MDRKRYIDISKIIAAFCIVIIHVNISTMHLVENQLTQRHVGLALGLQQAIYIMVVVFTMLTGAGLLSSDKARSYKSMFPYILKLVISALAFGTLFEVSKILINHEEISFTTFVIDLLKGTTWSHMWYLNCLIGLYILMPVLKALVDNVNGPILFAIITGLYILFCIMPVFGRAIHIPYLSGGTNIGVFVMSALIGYLIEKSKVKIIRLIMPFTIVVTIAVCIFMASVTYNNHNYYFINNNPIVIVAAACFIISMKGICKDKKSEDWMIKSSANLLGVYIVHPAFIHIVSKFTDFNPHLIGNEALVLVLILIMSLLIYLISMLLIFILRKIKIVKKYLL